MTEPTVLRSATAVTAALCNEQLVPPPRPAALADGPTADLRDAMARFSGPQVHASRRSEVVALIESIPLSEAAATARRLTATLLDSQTDSPSFDAITDVALIIPVTTLVALIGGSTAASAAPSPADIVADVAAVAAVVGRGEARQRDSDAAVTRLHDVFAECPAGPVAAISLLYQCHDATALLIGATLWAAQTNALRPPTVLRTVRVALHTTTIGAAAGPGTDDVLDLDLAEGDTVVLDLAATGLEWGAGPHECPGRMLAEAIAGGVVAALSDAGCTLSPNRAVLDEHGRPTSLPMERPAVQ